MTDNLDPQAAAAASSLVPTESSNSAAVANDAAPVQLTTAPGGKDVTPVVAGYAEKIAELVPGATLTGDPDASAPVKSGVLSHIVAGIADRLREIAHIPSGPAVDKLGDDIERAAADQEKLALEFLQKLKSAAAGDVSIILHDTELAVREIAFGAIPAFLRPLASGYFTRIVNAGEQILHPRPEGAPEDQPQAVSVVLKDAQPAEQSIAIALQHGINGLKARIGAIFGR